MSPWASLSRLRQDRKVFKALRALVVMFICIDAKEPKNQDFRKMATIFIVQLQWKNSSTFGGLKQLSLFYASLKKLLNAIFQRSIERHIQ